MSDIVETIPFLPSTIENIDTSVFEWLNGDLNLYVNTNGGFKKVPCLWLSAERTYQIKNNKDLRDSAGKLKLPLITVVRDSMIKDPTFRGSHFSHIFENKDYKGGATPVAKRIVQRKTRNFANSDAYRSNKDGSETAKIKNDKIVYQTYEMPVPTYVTMMYSINIRTEYLQQMNDLVAPFITLTGGINSFVLKRNGHIYEVFIEQGFDPSSNIKALGDEERYFQTEVKLKVLGYLMGEGINREKPQVIVRENVVDVKISREKVIIGDKIPWKPSPDKYRE